MAVRRRWSVKTASLLLPGTSSASSTDFLASVPPSPLSSLHGCQMVIGRFLDPMCLALRASGLRLRYATSLRPHTLHPGAIQGKEGIEFFHLATLLSPRDEEEHDADADAGEDDAAPDLLAERVHEGEHAGPLLGRFLDHYRYSLRGDMWSSKQVVILVHLVTGLAIRSAIYKNIL